MRSLIFHSPLDNNQVFPPPPRSKPLHRSSTGAPCISRLQLAIFGVIPLKSIRPWIQYGSTRCHASCPNSTSMDLYRFPIGRASSVRRWSSGHGSLSYGRSTITQLAISSNAHLKFMSTLLAMGEVLHCRASWASETRWAMGQTSER